MSAIPFVRFDHRKQRTWRHYTIQFKTRLVTQVPRIHCKAHGIKSLKVLMADTQARFTPLFERFAIDVLSACSNKTQAAKLLGLSWDEVHHIQSRAVKRGWTDVLLRLCKNQYLSFLRKQEPSKIANPAGVFHSISSSVVTYSGFG